MNNFIVIFFFIFCIFNKLCFIFWNALNSSDSKCQGSVSNENAYTHLIVASLAELI